MDVKSLQLNCRFSLPPNSLGYCGKDSAAEKFKSCITGGKCKGVEKEISHFIVLYPYLKTIAKISGHPIFSYEVVEAYWMGNKLLDLVKLVDFDLLLENFSKQGVPDFLVRKLKKNKPKAFVPNHLFQVLFVGVGQASGAVPFNLDSINNCMIRWGKVEKIIKNKAWIELNSLEKKSGYRLVKNRQEIPFDSDITSDLKVGNSVAVHWNMIVKKLTKDEENKLFFWCKKTLEAIQTSL
jgi:hypothetical protein